MEENKNMQTQEEANTNKETEEKVEPITVDSLMAELAQLKAESAKNKAALDKALHSNGELTKQLRAKMTASEQEAEVKREAEEAQANRIKELKTTSAGPKPENDTWPLSGCRQTLQKKQQMRK